MSQDHKITADASPASLYQLNPEFQTYNLNVFRFNPRKILISFPKTN
jgi:hypothetical protein